MIFFSWIRKKYTLAKRKFKSKLRERDYQSYLKFAKKHGWSSWISRSRYFSLKNQVWSRNKNQKSNFKNRFYKKAKYTKISLRQKAYRWYNSMRYSKPRKKYSRY